MRTLYLRKFNKNKNANDPRIEITTDYTNRPNRKNVAIVRNNEDFLKGVDNGTYRIMGFILEDIERGQ